MRAGRRPRRYQQLLRVSLHFQSVPARRVALAEFAVLGGGQADSAEQPMRPVPHERTVADDGGSGARTDRQVRKERFNLVAIQRRGRQVLQRAFHQRPAVFAGYDHSAADLTGFDHRSENREAVEKAKAGIGNVEDLGLAGSPSFRCANAAVAGSSMSRQTAAWMKVSICSGRRADCARTARPAAALASDGRVPGGQTGARECRSSTPAARTAAGGARTAAGGVPRWPWTSKPLPAARPRSIRDKRSENAS